MYVGHLVSYDRLDEPVAGASVVSVDQTDVVDHISIDRASGAVHLAISDQMPWGVAEGTHLQFLQDKLNTYLRFVESGELAETYPAIGDKDIVIVIFGKHAPSPAAERFLRLARPKIEQAGIALQFVHLQLQ